MANKRRGEIKICPYCGKEFYVPLARIKRAKNNYCSIPCVSRGTALERSKKLRKKDYPFNFPTPCIYCGGNIIIKNAGFDKPNRKFCSASCRTSYQNQIHIATAKQKELASIRLKNLWKSDEFRKKMSSESKRINNSNAIMGEKHWNWQGGKTALSFKERNNMNLKKWTRNVFQRDNYTCQNCGARSGKGKRVDLEAHHIKRWSEYKELRYELSNGITLCENCHSKTENYKGKGTHRPDIYKPITQFTLQGNKIKDWQSIESAALSLGILKTSLGNCLKLRTKSAGGFKWKYQDLLS